MAVSFALALGGLLGLVFVAFYITLFVQFFILYDEAKKDHTTLGVASEINKARLDFVFIGNIIVASLFGLAVLGGLVFMGQGKRLVAMRSSRSRKAMGGGGDTVFFD